LFWVISPSQEVQAIPLSWNLNYGQRAMLKTKSKGLKMKIVKKWVTQLIFFNENKTGRV